MTTASCTLAVVLILLCAHLHCSSHASPERLWTRTIPNGGSIDGEGMKKGNGVVLSTDEATLWITSELGSLHVFDVVNGDRIRTLSPDTIEDRFTESRSSVSLYQPDDSIRHAVYAVIDIPHGRNATIEISSRIITVNGSSGDYLAELYWSTTVQGAVEGTPVISSDGTRIYIVHNTKDFAHFSVLNSSNGEIVSQTVDIRPMTKYGPISLLTENGIDHVYWADANEHGYAAGGRMHTVLSTNLTQPDMQRSFASSTTLPPTVSKSGNSIWVGGRDATVHGWANGSIHPLWSTQLSRSPRNESFPIINRIETDAAGERLFVPSSSSSFHCLDANSGDVLWSTSSNASLFLTGAKYSSTHNVVYAIEHLSGAVTQYHAETGQVNWKFDCQDLGESAICQASVEADFALSSDGMTLYFGDIYGRIHAVKVADEPSSMPSTAPSQMPTTGPTVMPSTSTMPSTETSQLPTTAPTTAPSLPRQPSKSPSMTPTTSASPSLMPSPLPSAGPSTRPSISMIPSSVPSEMPSTSPSISMIPTSVPSEMPSIEPSFSPGPSVFIEPSGAPSVQATVAPTTQSKRTSEPSGQDDQTTLPPSVSNTSSATSQGIWLSILVVGALSVLHFSNNI